MGARLLLGLLLLGCSTTGELDSVTCVCGFSSEHEALVFDAAEEWRSESDGRVRLQMRSGDSEDCELRIVATRGLVGENGNVAGRTLISRDLIRLDPDDGDGMVWSAALHEIGHYLTGEEHSDNTHDVMFGSASPWMHLTARDVARLD